MRNKKYIYIYLFFVGMILVVMPAIPHHHHGNGIICMKDDIKETDCCAAHNDHHHQGEDPCCNDDCTAGFLSSTPSVDTEDFHPSFTRIHILYTESLIRFLTQPIKEDIHKDYVYVEQLHGTCITRAAGLRAPPSLG